MTYQAALTPYYGIDPDDPMERWVHYEGTGVYGFLTDTITGRDAAGGYSGDSVVISGIDGSTCIRAHGHINRRPGHGVDTVLG
ncbi:hypothetical protein [Methanoculleus bourgensis]|uniref:hypothetical protein n=1 Tax=Methanoculleus bourgensis TaxID=83986 RepID=UPI000783CA8A|nr:hypothetical protein [Methanoculleus bourgensis]